MSLKPKITISETKIRQVIWMIKTGKSKKICCEHLGISYNTTRLTKIIADFKEKQIRTEQLKEEARNKTLSNFDKATIISRYIDDNESISGIADSLYITFNTIKKVLIESNVPLRSRGKHKQAKVEHIVQDLDRKFQMNEKVFYAKRSCYGIIKEVLDEDYLDYLQDIRREHYVKYNIIPKEGVEPAEGIHYEVYYELADKAQWKRIALQEQIRHIEQLIIETGREYYRVFITDVALGGFLTLRRSELFPVESI